MPQVNPEILRWARETAGLTLEEASSKLNIQEARGVSPKERLQSLETGETDPSRPMLLKMAKHYRRPLIVFYMEKPPQTANRGNDFRTLPESYTNVTNGLVDALLRDVQVRQNILRSALEDEEEIKPLAFVGSMKMVDGVEAVVHAIIETIAFNLQEFRKQPSPQDAFKYLRTQVENAGVFVLLIGDLGSHHTALDLEAFRGIALADEIAPFVVINDKDSRAAWSFTLLHELAHIWLGHTGISNVNSELDVEKFCNSIASDILLPDVDLKSFDFESIIDFEDRKTSISNFAYAQNISSSMVAYKLYLLGKIDRQSWAKLHREFRKMWLDARDEARDLQRGKTGGPSYYVVRRHRLGENLISQVHQMILGGTLTTTKASRVLGVAPKNVQNLIEPKISLNA